MTQTALPNGQTLRMQPRAVDLPGKPAALSPPPAYGQETRQLLLEAGYDDREISDLAAAGIVATGLPA